MSSISSVSHPPIPSVLSSNSSAPARDADGDSASQEAAESSKTKIAEAQNGGSAPSKNLVNKVA
jgi:hypothetical protein